MKLKTPRNGPASAMKSHNFIERNLDAVLEEWQGFSTSALPAANSAPELAAFNHYREILLDVVEHMQAGAAPREPLTAATDAVAMPSAAHSRAAAHGALRYAAGFDLEQVVGEFSGLRLSGFALWRLCQRSDGEAARLEEIVSFNAAVDRALSEAIQSHAKAGAATRDMFLAILGHDLRGPLHSIQVAADLVALPQLPDSARIQAAMRILRGSNNMHSLITDLLEFTGTRMGRHLPIARADCDLRQACEEALEAIRAVEPQRAFVQSVSGELQMRADGARLRQVLSNLLNNAVQHGDPQAPILLSARGDKDAVVLAVANSGQPIPQEALRTIFEPLVQMPSSSSAADWRSKSSLGLGLFIAREIVLRHQGTIDVESSREAGTVFTIRLPRALASEVSVENC